MKQYVVICVWALAALSGFCAETVRPNFLFIYTDDQRWDAVGVVQREQGERGRFPWFTTPNMDRLAAEGIRFRQAFVTLSLCAPSRACSLTGRYNHLNGVANNYTEFPLTNITWATELRKAGYTTAYIGKWHMSNQRGKRPGFDYSASFIGHSHYMNSDFEINGVSKPTKGWIDDVSTDFAIKFIRSAPKNKPWAMAVGFKSPHGPAEPPARVANKFANENSRPVPNMGQRAPFIPKDSKARSGATVNVNYFRCLAAADENLGHLLSTLDELKIADDTIVIYTSDNGYYMGEHGLGNKCSGYEESLRVPLLVRYPRLGMRGKVIDQMVLNLDLAPTLLDFAGAPVPKEMQGLSWRPLLEGKTVPWRKSFFFEYFWEQQKGTIVPSLTGVRTEKAKFVKYKDRNEWTELYDLIKDPFELKNLIADPASAALRDEMLAEYRRQKHAVRYVWPSYATDEAKFKNKVAKQK